MKTFLQLALILIAIPCHPAGQKAVFFGQNRSAGGSCSLPFSDAFSGSGALSSCWAQTSAGGYVALVQSSGKAVPTTSGGQGIATVTGTYPAAQYGQMKLPFFAASQGGSTAVCVNMTTTGNGYCWDLANGFVYIITAGAYAGTISGLGIGACASPSTNDTVKLSFSAPNLTCLDVTTSVSASGTDSTYGAGNGNPGMLVDQSASTLAAAQNWTSD